MELAEDPWVEHQIAIQASSHIPGPQDGQGTLYSFFPPPGIGPVNQPSTRADSSSTTRRTRILTEADYQAIYDNRYWKWVADWEGEFGFETSGLLILLYKQWLVSHGLF
jgi:hypothetical protein